MKKVFIVTGSMRRGGAERVISIISKHYVSLDWEVYLVRCLSKEIEYNIDSKIKLFDISRQNKNQILDTPRLIYRLRKLIKQEKPDVVLSFMVTINFISALACRGLNVRFYPSERNDPTIGRSFFWKIASEWSYGQGIAAIMQTRRARDAFNEKVRSKSVVIPNPVSVEEYTSEEKEKTIVTVGRLEKQKNQKMLIAAFNNVYKKYPEYRLRFFGRGSLELELRSQVNELGLTSAVDFMGNVEDVHYQIRSASVFVLCSDYEGMSNALIEAMMMGLPCISTDCAGADEIIENGESGIIIKCGDVMALSEAMCYLIENRDVAEMYAKEARKRTISRFNERKVCEMWSQIIEKKTTDK